MMIIDFIYFYLRFVADVNECDYQNGGCELKCINTNGSYYCSCADGHYLTSDFVCAGIVQLYSSWQLNFAHFANDAVSRKLNLYIGRLIICESVSVPICKMKLPQTVIAYNYNNYFNLCVCRC